MGDHLNFACSECQNQQGQYFLERIQSLARRSGTFIRDIHRYSMISSRQEPFRPTDLNMVLREALSCFEEQIEKKGAVIEVGDLPSLEVDAAQMSDVFRHLLSNALKKVLERHEGSITATSKPVLGSTFIITLPVKRD